MSRVECKYWNLAFVRPRRRRRRRSRPSERVNLSKTSKNEKLKVNYDYDYDYVNLEKERQKTKKYFNEASIRNRRRILKISKWETVFIHSCRNGRACPVFDVSTLYTSYNVILTISIRWSALGSESFIKRY